MIVLELITIVEKRDTSVLKRWFRFKYYKNCHLSHFKHNYLTNWKLSSVFQLNDYETKNFVSLKFFNFVFDPSNVMPNLCIHSRDIFRATFLRTKADNSDKFPRCRKLTLWCNCSGRNHQRGTRIPHTAITTLFSTDTKLTLRR